MGKYSFYGSTKILTPPLPCLPRNSSFRVVYLTLMKKCHLSRPGNHPSSSLSSPRDLTHTHTTHPWRWEGQHPTRARVVPPGQCLDLPRKSYSIFHFNFHLQSFFVRIFRFISYFPTVVVVVVVIGRESAIGVSTIVVTELLLLEHG